MCASYRLQIHNIAGGWHGGGDDMVFVDGETWPSSVHGTGSEEIFGGGACPATEYAGFYHSFHLIESRDYSGLIGARAGEWFHAGRYEETPARLRSL